MIDAADLRVPLGVPDDGPGKGDTLRRVKNRQIGQTNLFYGGLQIIAVYLRLNAQEIEVKRGLLHDGGVELLLILEILVERSLGIPRFPGQHIHRYPVIAVFPKKDQRRLKN